MVAAAVSAVGATTVTMLTGALLIGTGTAWAALPTVGLGTATSFAVLGGESVTNVGNSIVSGDLGVSPGSSITGFPPGVIINGVRHQTDAVAGQAQIDLVTAYNDAAGRTPATLTGVELGGQILPEGVYTNPTFGLTGTLVLDGQGRPDSVFIFQAGSTLITAPNSTVALINGAQACNVFWQIGSSATLNTNTTFVGTVMALADISVLNATTVQGRLLARTGSVTLINNVITRPFCALPPTGGPTATPTGTGGPGPSPSITGTPGGPGPSPSITGTPGGPGPSPSITGTPGGPGPSPSITGTPGGPRPSPSITRTPGGPRPSATRTTPGPRPTKTGRPHPRPTSSGYYGPPDCGGRDRC